MSHEIVIYGFIVGSAWRREDYRKYQRMNVEIIRRTPVDAQWPYLTPEMFSSPDPDDSLATFRRQVIHFGASTKEHGDEYVQEWIPKFECLLGQLYWHSATAHIKTETFGAYKYEWMEDAEWRKADGKFVTNLDIDELPPTSRWTRRTA